MKSLLQLAGALALISVGAGAALASWDVHKVLTRADASLLRGQTWASHESENVHSILLSAKDATETAATFAHNQQAQLDKTSKDSDHLVRASNLVIRNAETLLYHTDQELNSQLLPHLDQQIADTASAAQTSFESLSYASEALTFQLHDPAIGQTLSGLNLAANSVAVASQNFAQMTAKGDDILAHGDHVAAYWDKKLTTPTALWKSLLLGGLRVGADSANIYAGFVK